ncbi:MAG: peptidylprolyl isomerase [Euryhalocaulis sp.]|uniref:peptidylprolyl isomerase n=1 Tax=Euryhalocaulis sp. TaxID=2744307 RepID=UPI0017D1F7EC|nr:peptidylprolyl isomerase [Euryhalocaulis sp.]MBA4801723.1 peptidylprolyl isomerase [Euryhalocaulis sp.]
MSIRSGLFLLLAAIALAACSDESSPEASVELRDNVTRLGDTVAAEVGETRIYVSDVEREAAAQGAIAPGDRISTDSDAYSRVLDELIDQRLLAMEAARRGLADTDEARRRLQTARERILGNVLVETAVDESVTEDAIRRMYDEQVRLVELGDEVRARHILVETREAADEIKAQLDEGADFAQLAFDNSIDEATRLDGGDLGYFTSDAMVAPFSTAAYATPVGETSDPFETEFGWHIVKVEDRRAQQRPSFEELRPRIVRFMTFDEIQNLLDDLRDNTEITVRDAPAVSLEGDAGSDDEPVTLEPAPQRQEDAAPEDNAEPAPEE